LVAAGRTNAEIAASLHLAPSSVKKLVSRCLARLGVRNRVEAALLARREGLVASPPARAGS
ncbi:MAG TPA: LuxR C-terminal-related transcriptional regulator, partial [Gaiellaceae bacterium]|nr:LuxR C-terminal-related transcriptional regulator [Gaiellaceae bacterium]